MLTYLCVCFEQLLVDLKHQNELVLSVIMGISEYTGSSHKAPRFLSHDPQDVQEKGNNSRQRYPRLG